MCYEHSLNRFVAIVCVISTYAHCLHVLLFKQPSSKLRRRMPAQEAMATGMVLGADSEGQQEGDVTPFSDEQWAVADHHEEGAH